MYSVSVAQGGSDRLRPYLRACLKKASREGVIDAALCTGQQADLLIVPPDAPVSAGSGGMLLAVGGSPRGGENCVSCGLGYGDALTLSSIGRDSAMLALQEDIPTLKGGTLEPQEIPISLEAPAEPEAVLAAAGAMLLLGADTSEGIKLP